LSTLPAIVLSGHTMALGVVRALAAMSVPVHLVHYAPKHFAQASRHLIGHWRAPDPELEEMAFIEFLLTGRAGFEGGVLFPVCDATLVAVARHKDALSNRYVVACPDWPVTHACIDKCITYGLATEAGLATPATFHARSLQEAERYAQRADYPCLVKPTESHRYYERFGRKMSVVKDAADLLARYREVLDAGLEVVMQELIPGADERVVNYNCYMADGRPVAEFTAEHTRNGPPNFGSQRVARSRWIPEVIAPGRDLLRALEFEGYACVEFKRDRRDGQYKLMEVNARHNLSTALAVRCGINFPYIDYRHRTGNRSAPVHAFARGVYWIDLCRDIGFSLRYRAEEKYSWRQLLEPYWSPHVFAIADVRDPMPLVRRIVFLLSSGAKAAMSATGRWPRRLRRLVGATGRPFGQELEATGQAGHGPGSERTKRRGRGRGRAQAAIAPWDH
jgi:predicted ATP-grasp superfamily ATP-dependent carboligase